MNFYTPSEIAVQFCKAAQAKNALSNSKIWVFSVLGGAFIALGGLLALAVVGGMPQVAATNPGITKLLFGTLFPLGLIMVVMGGARNFFGALIVAYFFAHQTGIFNSDPWHAAAVNISIHKVEHSFWVTFIKGVLANWLVCMAVWLGYAAKDVGGKALLLWFPVMGFVVLGMEHSVANMFFIPTSMLLGAPISMYQFLVQNMLPATLGNIVGAVLFVALPYWYMFKDHVKAAQNLSTNGQVKITLKQQRSASIN
ncbi:MAG: formate/nitrite transporter family protein [Bacteroidetes bacterium]|nr:MAG: formate/nitrite transporter family protein [Bacteroidota bacterium]